LVLASKITTLLKYVIPANAGILLIQGMSKNKEEMPPYAGMTILNFTTETK